MSTWAELAADAALVARWASLNGDNGDDSVGDADVLFAPQGYVDGPIGKVAGRAFQRTTATNLFATVAAPSELTVSLWFRIPTAFAGDQVLAGWVPSGGYYEVRLQNTCTRMQIIRNVDGTGFGNAVQVDGTYAGDWKHLAWTLSSADQHTLYLNGAQVGQGTLAIDQAAIGNSFRFCGGRTNAAGTIQQSDIRIYNRVLSASEIEVIATTGPSISRVSYTRSPFLGSPFVQV